MKIVIKILFVSIVFLIACENEEYFEIDNTYKEQLVVDCEIRPNQNFPGVRLTKTLPVGIAYNIELAEIKDATLYIRIDSVKIIPLHYKSQGIYKPLYDFKVNPGEYYELFGETDGKSFYSRTKIPIIPVIKSVSLNGNGFFAQSEVYSNKDECYAALWVVNTGTLKSAKDFFNVSVPTSFIVGSTTSVRTASYPLEYQSNNYNGSRYIKVYSFDHTFEQYFLTKNGNQEINNPYVQGSGTTVWNVSGNDVIGMFIGVAEGNLTPVN